MSSKFKWIIGIIVFLIFGSCYVYDKASKIENLVEKKVNKNLERAKLSHLNANVSGLDVRLSGNVSSEAERQRAIEACKVCNASVNTDGISMGSIDDYSFRANRSKEGMVTLSRSVPNQRIHDEILKSAQRVFGSENVRDEMEIENFIGEDTDIFLELSKNAITFLSDFEGESSVRVTIDETVYTGSHYQEDLKAKIDSSFDEIMSDHSTSVPEALVPVTTTILTTTTLPKVDCQNKINTILSKQKIRFNLSGYRVRKESFQLLEALAKTLGECPKWSIVVEGHTDTSGLRKPNYILSKKRAYSVKSKLVEYGVAAGRIKTLGYGESRPLVKERKRSDLAKNRRIEIKLQGE